MRKEYSKLHLFFILGLCLQQIALFFNYPLGSFVMQVIISLILLAAFCMETRLVGRFHKRLVIGLSFLLIGVCCLNMRLWLTIPLDYVVVSDLIAFYFLTKAFYLDFSSAPELDKKGARVAIACTAIMATGSYFALRPYLGRHQVIVLLITIVLSFTLMMACFRRERVSDTSFKTILIGMVLLAFHQGYLAKTIFILDTNYFQSAGSVLFLVAFYLLTAGGIKRKLIALPEEVE